ncbi:MAG: hypothetical protein NWT00_05050, partial [Beijerinckiaceae bacterium]|nr:hypothetical protein [Beijerinckiaceae bacterium]
PARERDPRLPVSPDRHGVVLAMVVAAARDDHPCNAFTLFNRRQELPASLSRGTGETMVTGGQLPTLPG